MERILSELNTYYGDWFIRKEQPPKMTNKLYPYKNMFKPIKINKLTIKNRLVMGPMGNISMCDETGRPGQKMIDYYTERAKGGVGLITTGLVPFGYGIDPSLIEPGKLTYFPRIDRSRTVFAGWRDITAGAHSHGASIFIQLTAGLGRVGNPQCLVNDLKLPVSASCNPNFYIPQIPCRRLCDLELKKLIKKAGQAAADSKAANFDGVYLHGHEGYLIEQLSNTAYNRRKIGHFANWQNFGLDLVKKIRARVGKDFPIMYRIDLSLMLNATYGEKMDSVKSLKKFKDERKIAETLDYMKNLVSAGVDIFDVDLGSYDNWWLPHPPATMPAGCFLTISKLVKDYFRKNKIISNAGIEVPVVGVGKLGFPDLAEQALKEGMCDMVMLARPLLADPEWPNKAYRGESWDIIPCIGCQEACIKEFVDGGHPECAVNPRTAFEHVFPAEIEKSKTPKRIAVIGAGPAGIVASDVLIARGHKVDLYEKNSDVGGMLIPGGKVKFKFEIENYRQYLKNRVLTLSQNKDFSLLLNTEASLKDLKEKNYDVIFVATGTKQSKPKIDGIDNPNVYNAIEIFNDISLVDKAKDIVIVGGGDSGCELAYFLKYDLGKNVTIVEATENLMTNSCTANRNHIIYYLEKAFVKVHNCSLVQSININKTITINQNVSKTVSNPFNTWQPILPENIQNPFAKKIKSSRELINVPADIVILAFGNVSNNSLYFDLVSENAANEIYNVGDSNRLGKVFTAVKSAYRKAISV